MVVLGLVVKLLWEEAKVRLLAKESDLAVSLGFVLHKRSKYHLFLVLEQRRRVLVEVPRQRFSCVLNL